MIAKDLPPQTSINPAADAYSETSLLLSSTIPRIADLGFGPDPEQRLDIYLPGFMVEPDAALPVFLFWHGGGFTHGHKEWCGFMAPAIVSTPALFVAANYRLFPRVNSEALMDDARSATRWVLDNISRYGGDPARLVIGGHSAGGSISARLELDAERRRAAGISDGAISAVLPMSGSYATRASERHADPTQRVPLDQPDCPAEFSGMTKARFTVAWGTEERLPIPGASADFADYLERSGTPVRRMPFEGEDHFSVHLATADAENAYRLAVVEELNRAKAPGLV